MNTTDTVITVKNVGKKYKITHSKGGYITLRDVITTVFQNPFKFLKSKTKAALGIGTEDFWALKDVNFEVKKGEVVGIIGRNGAGKSTLLKILSQITPPTEGEIKIHGRVGSLLEVGTGFHPELTGRENIFLNGAILGMKRKEIAKKFDAIVEFAGIEKFLDTPVKYYSSGMYVRLAFSVAAHMEPDILIIDEVLAVGDSDFQKKCLGKMDEITKKEGRTILFVSHNMEAIRQLCPKTILINAGKIEYFGDTNDTMKKYTSQGNTRTHKNVEINAIPLEKEWARGTQMAVNIHWKNMQLSQQWDCDLIFYSIDGTRLFALQGSKVPGFLRNPNSKGVQFLIENPGFTEKEIRMDFGLKKTSTTCDYELVIENCLTLKPSIKNTPLYTYQTAAEGIISPLTTCNLLQ
ncbi:MAG: ABC transporter ATP-binding protein [Candidatus Paceibacterota bacterium]|jgi:lipopolysaccharide transport system ATP-binding protein